LQFAIAVAFAGLAIAGMVIEQQFNDIAACLADFGRVGLHLHPFPHLATACRHVKTHPLHIDDADAARAHQT
jgi:hypothetical protein